MLKISDGRRLLRSTLGPVVLLICVAAFYAVLIYGFSLFEYNSEWKAEQKNFEKIAADVEFEKQRLQTSSASAQIYSSKYSLASSDVYGIISGFLNKTLLVEPAYTFMWSKCSTFIRMYQNALQLNDDHTLVFYKPSTEIIDTVFRSILPISTTFAVGCSVSALHSIVTNILKICIRQKKYEAWTVGRNKMLRVNVIASLIVACAYFVLSFFLRFPPKCFTAMGLTTMGLTTKGPTTKGLTTKGLATMGLTTKGPTTKGLTTKGLTTMGLTTMGLTTKGLTTKGLATMGLTTMGLTTKGLTTMGLTTMGLATKGLTTMGLTTKGLTMMGLTTKGLTTTGITTKATISASRWQDVSFTDGIKITLNLIATVPPSVQLKSITDAHTLTALCFVIHTATAYVIFALIQFIKTWRISEFAIPLISDIDQADQVDKDMQVQYRSKKNELFKNNQPMGEKAE